MQKEIPEFLYNRLIKQYGNKIFEDIINGYTKKRKVTLRVNAIKTNQSFVQEELKKASIDFEVASFNSDALIIENADESKITTLKIYEDGYIYLQSLSAMLPAIVMEPKPNENILDMTAAPGGKTTQLSALSGNLALITACEKNKVRAERLKYNIQKQGASKVSVLVKDSRKLDNYFCFDKVLLDAPCSGSGTINVNDDNFEKYFTEELIRRSVKIQYELLKKAVTVLKTGHEMVYSTCSILEEENENNIKRLLSNNKKLELIPIDVTAFKGIPLLPTSLDGTIGVCPNELYEGFFIAKLRKL